MKNSCYGIKHRGKRMFCYKYFTLNKMKEVHIMSKKILKRSLALGALMAFVITGSVWAGEVVWNGESELESAIVNGKAITNIQDGKIYANTAYCVIGSNEKVDTNIEVDANYGYESSAATNAAVLLDGDRGTKITGNIVHNVRGISKNIVYGVVAMNGSQYVQNGNLTFSVQNTGKELTDKEKLWNNDGFFALRAYNGSNAEVNGDINVNFVNAETSRALGVVMQVNSKIDHVGDLNLYAHNFTNVYEQAKVTSGYYLYNNNEAVSNLTGDVNMTFIANDGKEHSVLKNIYGVQLHSSTLNHTGNINFYLGGKASELLNVFPEDSQWDKSKTIYAYIEGDGGVYNRSEENVNTLSFGAVDTNGNKVPFISTAEEPLKWSFANFDVVKVTEDSSLFIDANQRVDFAYDGEFLHQNYRGDFEITSDEIHSTSGNLNLGANTLILEDNASATMNGLNSNGAKITLGEGATLTVKEELEGDATFALTALDEGQVVVGSANGEYTAEISSDKLEEGTSVKGIAVDGNGKDLISKVVGTSSSLYDSGSALVNEDGTLSEIKRNVAATNVDISDMAALGLMSWRAEMNDMNKRMGELRNANGEHGVWVRMVRGEDEYKNVKSQYNQYQLGYDEKLSVDKRWTVGMALSYTDGETSFAKGNGENTNKALSIYGSKLNNDGTFVDLIAKYARLENDFKAYDGIEDADYSTNGYSVSAEFGKRIQQGNGLWIEPQAELTYGKVSAVDYLSKAGVKVAQDGMESIVGRVGFSIGKDISKGNVYARASYLYDFDGETAVTLNGKEKLEQDLGGGWWEVGVGANINLSKATYIYADVEKTFGGEVDTNWQWNLGVRYSF